MTTLLTTAAKQRQVLRKLAIALTSEPNPVENIDLGGGVSIQVHLGHTGSWCARSSKPHKCGDGIIKRFWAVHSTRGGVIAAMWDQAARYGLTGTNF